MTRAQIFAQRDKAYARLTEIFGDVTEGRWDNTHTTGQLRACVAMHTAATEQLAIEHPDAFARTVMEVGKALAALRRFTAKPDQGILGDDISEALQRMEVIVLEGGGS
jgi:hypothetical protein